MKNIAIIGILLSCIILSIPSSAQYRTAVNDGLNITETGYRPSFDNDIQLLRHNIDHNMRYHIDDYTLYVPGAVMLGLKAAGYKGRSSWGRMLVSDAFSGALMAGVVNGLKYSVRRPRPDGTSRNSFPSGHTATAFMTATMLHKEYGWRSPWFSIGGYTLAAFTGTSRILNNRHWSSDVMAGAVIGIGSVHLGYFLADLIFKDRYLNEDYRNPDMSEYDPGHKYYEVGIYIAGRFILGNKAEKADGSLPFRGSSSGITVHIPMIPRSGLVVRGGVNELTFLSPGIPYATVNMYNALAGGYWTYPLPRYVEFDIKAMIGYAWHRMGNGIDIAGEASAALRAGENFRIKAFATYETFSFTRQKPFINSFMLGIASAFCW